MSKSQQLLRSKNQTNKLVIVISSVGVILLLLISFTLPFNQGIFTQIFNRPNSHAATTLQVGANLESAIDYGFTDLKPTSRGSDTDNDLSEVKRMGGSIVRVFVGNCLVSDTESANRLDSFLTKAQSYGIQVIPTLIDFYNSCHNNQSTGQYYTDTYQSLHLLGDSFFASGYQTSFKPFVQTVVSKNKDHSNIYAWEIGNELEDNSNNTHFINFMNDISSTIKSIDSSHRIATGMMYAAHTGLTPATLYPNLQNIDIITVHSYNSDQTGGQDLDWAVQNGKIGIVEEIGFSGTSGTDRANSLQQAISYFSSHGAQAFLQWGFIAKGLTDNGDGDTTFGMDTIWHTDYDSLFSVYSTTASTVQTPFPTTTPNSLPTCNSVTASISPNSVSGGQQITLSLSGDASTFIGDTFGSGVTNCQVGWNSSGGSTSCVSVPQSNTTNYTWTHTWKHCVGSLNNCSSTCSVSANYSVIAPTPAPTITPTPSPTPTVSPSPSATPFVEGDFTNDGHVTLADLSIFANSYGTSAPNIPDPRCNLNNDDKVDLADLSLFAADYGK